MPRIKKSRVTPRLQGRSARLGLGDEAIPDLSVRRAKIMGLALALAALGLVSRLWYMQIAREDQYVQMAQANRSRLIRQPAARGLIVDSRGHILAASRSQYAVYADPAVASHSLVLKRLADILGDTPDDIAETIASLKKSAYDPIRIGIDVPISIVSRIEEQKAYLQGVTTGSEPVRWYPQGALLGNTLGSLGRIDPADVGKAGGEFVYSPNDFVGKTGLECRYESELRGISGGVQVEIDAHGRPIKQIGRRAPSPGHALQLTVDERVQAAAEAAFRAKGWQGAAAAVDPQTGAVIALVSSPSVNPNVFAMGVKTNVWRSLNANPSKPLLNRAVDALYPPGSTFKQVVAAAGLESGATTTRTSVYCTGVYHLGKARFHCWAMHGETDFYKAIADSCDIFFYQLGLRMGPDTLSRYAVQYPLAQPTGIDLPHEMIGSIPSPAWKKKRFDRKGSAWSRWYDGDTLNTSIGQGYVLVTPLQMALVTATTANGGYVLRPYLVRKIAASGPSGKDQITQAVVLRRVPISADNLAEVRHGMRDCVTSGTGKIVDFPGIATAAKTGSAQVAGQARTHGWFVAFAPFDHPAIACAAIVEHGGHGAASAGIVVKAMLESYFGLKDNGIENGVSD